MSQLTVRSPYGDDEPSFGPDTWVPSSLIQRNQVIPVRDPYKVALRVLPVVLLHGLWASLVVCARHLPTRRMPAPWSVSPLLHSLLGGILGLLLAFRTNQAWTRYWTAGQSWAHVHRACHSLARTAAALAPTDPATYSSLMRHLIALPISLKQRARGGLADPSEYFWPVLAPGEAEAVVRSPVPHLVLLSSLSLLLLPVKQRDDGSGKDLALWSQCEAQLNELQSAAASLDLTSRLPPPASYSTHTVRMLLLWLATLPFVLVDVISPVLIPPVIMAVGWALYSTEELAKLLDEPFGRAADRTGDGDEGGAREGGDDGWWRRLSRRCRFACKTLWCGPWQGGVPEAVPVEAYCDRIASELQQQVAITELLQRRVGDGRWVVKPRDLQTSPFKSSGVSARASDATDVDGEGVVESGEDMDGVIDA